MNALVVIGNGPAAHRLVDQLGTHGHTGTITVLGAEPHPAYNRALLPSVLNGALGADFVRLPEPPADVRVHLGTVVTDIDRSRHLVHTAAGSTHHYDTLVLATGARPHPPDLPRLRGPGGGLAQGAMVLRTLDDCDTLTRTVRQRGRTTILGAGVLGVETACGLATRGVPVTLVHPHPYPMQEQLDATGGRILAEHLRELGITLHLGTTAIEYETGALTLDDGHVITAETTVVCTGGAPDAGLARKAGLAVHRGVVVDERLRTSDPHIHAIGDCTEHDGRVSESITNAWDQADTLAALLAGPEHAAPWHPAARLLRLKAAGIDLVSIGPIETLVCEAGDTEKTTLSDPVRRRYAAVALSREQVAAAVVVNLPSAVAELSRLHDADRPLPADRLAFLLGTTPAQHTGTAEPPADAVVCRCNTVTKKRLTEAFRRGAHDVPALARATRATTGCGSCTDEVRHLCRTLAANPPTEEQPSEQDPVEQEPAA